MFAVHCQLGVAGVAVRRLGGGLGRARSLGGGVRGALAGALLLLRRRVPTAPARAAAA